jgi:VanZ family protein
VLWAVGIFLASSIPGSGIPRNVVFAHDKLLHALVFAGLGACAWHALRRPVPAWLIAVGWGGLDELHQKFVPGRMSDPWDLAADAAGAALGVGVVLMAAMYARRRAR